MNVFMKKCTEEDFEDFYILRCDKENIYWTGHLNIPEKSNLKVWYLEQLKKNDRIMLLIRYKELHITVGYLYIDTVDNYDKEAEISYGVHNEFKGKGIGTKIISMAIEYIRSNMKGINKISGWIIEENKASIKVFLKNSFCATDKTKEYFMDNIEKNVIMRKYIYSIER